MAKKFISKKDKYISKEKFMTEDEIKYINDCINKINQNVGSMAELYARWNKEEEAYLGDQPLKDKRPNTRVNIINANIEGQVSALVEQNIAVSTIGEGPSDKEYSQWARIGLDWTFRKNRIKRVIEQHERRRLKYGTGIFKVYFDEDAISGFGLAKITSMPLTRIFIDNKVKDPLRYQESEYFAEAIRLSKTQFIDLYSEDKASAISYGNVFIEDTTTFNELYNEDDDNGATLIQWWERYKGKLRLIEFSGCGVMLYDSHKIGDRKDNQKNSKYDRKPYYKFVDNKYPYFLTTLYAEEGHLWGFGDVKLLRPIQDMINDLYDKIRICARPNLTLISTESEVDVEDFDENSLEPRPYEAIGSGQPVISVPWGSINPAWWNLLSAMHEEAQRVTRYSELMMGQRSTANTATEASIQQQQGNSTTDHKKIMLQETLIEVAEYALGLMMEFYKEAKAFRITEDEDKYKWIDFRELSKVPVMKPSTRGFRKKHKENNPDNISPEWELLEENGKPITKNVDLDIEISIGAGLPKNKTFLWQMAEKLSQMSSIDKNGLQKPAISWEELRGFMKDFLGIPLKDEDVQSLMQQNPMQQGMPQQQGIPMQDANAPLAQGGNPAMSMLPNAGGVL